MRLEKLLAVVFGLVACSWGLSAQGLSGVTIDQENTAPGYTVYRPKDLTAAAAHGRLPVLVFGNGGCSRTSLGYMKMLGAIASEGYIVLAVGSVEPDRPSEGQNLPYSQLGREDFLVDALDWICRASADEKSIYFHKVDVTHIALAGHSCGGAQAMRASYDPRVTTTVMMNSGMGTMTMANASPADLDELHGPILYLIGGPEDVAYPNANLDYERIDTVPVVCANYPVGHSATYGEEGGGIFGEMLLRWLDWQLKGNVAESVFFPDTGWRDKYYPGWDVKKKNIDRL